MTLVQPEATVQTDSMIGFVLAGKYRVVRQIGRGGMGVVYEAEHVELGKRVAIKLMLEKYAQDGEASKRFEREALAASRIGNPHIIDVGDIGHTEDGRPFVVMELLSGMPLSQVIEMSGPLPPWRAIAIMKQVLRAVGAAHNKGIIHRDLKPDNIFISSHDDQHDFVKLLDFGISKMIDPDQEVAFTKLTTTGVVMGTPLYMAPEQAMGHVIERHADIYACGVILYEMLAGRPPFEGATYAVLVAKLLTQAPPLLRDVRPGLPAALVAAVHKALEKEPKDRFQTAEHFLLALPGEKTPSLLELAGTLDSSSGAVAVSPPTEKRVPKKWPLFAIGAAVVAAAGVVGFLAMNRASSSEAPRPEPARPSIAPINSPAPSPSVTVGQMQIRSVPAGASVFINDEERGLTPVEITLSPGRYKVRVELEGYDTIESEEDVLEKERTSMVLPLQKSAVAKPTHSHKPKDTTATPQPSPSPSPSPEPSKAAEPSSKPQTPHGTGKPNPYGGKPNPYK
jgi:serine/threonine protein kinase